MALVVLAALAVRVAYAIASRDWQDVQGDALTYRVVGTLLAEGQGWRRFEAPVPTAEFPPAQSTLIAALTLVGIGGVLGQKLVLCVLGAATVGLIGMLGRRVAGSDAAGLLAAAIAAVYPPLWVMSGTLLAETLYGVFVVGALLLASTVLDDGRSPRDRLVRFAALGGVIGLAALTRGEAAALLPLVGLPLAWKVRSGRGAVACTLAVVLALTPWTIRNLARFEEPVFISNNANGVWAGANCWESYYGDALGSWAFRCYGAAPEGDESERFVEYRRRGTTYARENVSRLPVVLAARLGRLYDVYQPWGFGTTFAEYEGRHPTATRAGLVAYWLLAPLAAVGAVILRRRRRSLLLVAAPVVLVTAVGLVTYGLTRFRFAAEPSFVILGAVTIDAAWRRWRDR